MGHRIKNKNILQRYESGYHFQLQISNCFSLFITIQINIKKQQITIAKEDKA